LETSLVVDDQNIVHESFLLAASKLVEDPDKEGVWRLPHSLQPQDPRVGAPFGAVERVSPAFSFPVIGFAILRISFTRVSLKWEPPWQFAHNPSKKASLFGSPFWHKS
jgi:hypothetical protein